MPSSTIGKNSVRIEKEADEIAASLIKTQAEFLGTAIENALGSLCIRFGAVRGVFFCLSDDGRMVLRTHEWCSATEDKAAHLVADLCFEAFAPHCEMLAAGETIRVSKPSRCPSALIGNDCRVDDKALRPFLIFPLSEEGRIGALLAFLGEAKEEKSWPEDAKALVTALSDAWINTVFRIRDETSLLKSAAKLQESERRYKMVSELTTDYWFRLFVDEDGNVTMDHITDNYFTITGRTKQDVLTVESWREVIVEEDMPKVLTLLKQLTAAPRQDRIECRSYIRGSQKKEQRWVDINVKSEVKKGELRVSSIIGAVKDITERKLAEEAMVRMNADLIQAKEAAEDKERLYRAIYNSTPVLMHSVDLNGNILSVNDHWLQTLGYKEEEVIGTSSFRYLTEESVDRAKKLRLELMEKGMLTNIEAQAVTQFGEKIDLLVGSKVVCDTNNKPTQIITTLLDISDRRCAERALRLRESYLTAIIENQPGLMWLKDASGRFLAVNRTFALACGREEPEDLVGKTDFDVWPADLAEKYRLDDEKIMKRGKSTVVEEQIYDKGEFRWFETFKTPVKNSEGKIIGNTGYAHDITVRKREEETLRNMQKLESLGVLAGGIAHDFNNLLGGIFGYIDIAAGRTTERPVQEMLSRALSTIDRAKGLTQQLLTFAKGGAPIKKAENLISFIPETAKFALSGSRVSCEFHIPDDLWLCEFDKTQVGQVLDNIVINAQQAMPGGGTIEIYAENLTLDENSHTILRPGNYVKVSVVDRGVGMPKDILPRIFDPFFTTKTKGHGLGLSTCYSIIHRHGGTIEVESTPGVGSAFHFYLPADPSARPSQLRPGMMPYMSFGTVIIMDDEEVIRDTVGNMLKSLGYAVISTDNGRDAVEIFRNATKKGGKIEAVILDLTVPGGMGGREALQEIRKIDLQVPVFVASGYADDPIMANPKNHGFTDSICKPFRRSDLAEMLRKTLEETTPT